MCHYSWFLSGFVSNVSVFVRFDFIKLVSILLASYMYMHADALWGHYAVFFLHECLLRHWTIYIQSQCTS